MVKNLPMEIILQRSYHPQGTNGMLSIKGQPAPLCYTIELPWRNNEPQRSCIPEGTYALEKRYSKQFKAHLHVTQVPGREWILIHPANHALEELKGCIAPVTLITGMGKGILSRQACKRLSEKVEEAIRKKEPISLTIVPLPAE